MDASISFWLELETWLFCEAEYWISLVQINALILAHYYQNTETNLFFIKTLHFINLASFIFTYKVPEDLSEKTQILTDPSLKADLSNNA